MSPAPARTELADRAQSTRLSEEEIRAHAQFIRQTLLTKSQNIREANFTRIGTGDLKFLFDAYDDRYLGGLCRKTLGTTPLHFKLSDRMTTSGGSTKRIKLRTGELRFEITIASGMLFLGFRDQRPTTACGIECSDRIDALQRIFEHELVHLLEFLCWEKSNCSAARFQDLAARLFLHRAHTHNLLTRQELAADAGIRRGSMVSFEFEGRQLTGRVQRITKRATVLVEDAGGALYTNGKRYLGYYIPLRALKIL